MAGDRLVEAFRQVCKAVITAHLVKDVTEATMRRVIQMTIVDLIAGTALGTILGRGAEASDELRAAGYHDGGPVSPEAFR